MARPTNPGDPSRLLRLPNPQGVPENVAMPVKMLAEVKGINAYSRRNEVGPEYVSRVRNLILKDKKLASRKGTKLLGQPAPSTIMQVLDFSTASGKRYTIALCLTHVGILSAATGVWNFQSVAWTGDEEDLFTFTAWGNKLLISNGVDGIWELTPSTSVLKVVPNAPGAKQLTTFAGRVIASATREKGILYPYRIRWSVKRDYTKWNEISDIGSGYEDLFGGQDGGTDEVAGVYPLSDTLALMVRDASLWQMSETGNVSIPFRFSRIEKAIGTVYRRTIVTTPNGVVFLSEHDAWLATLAGIAPIGRVARNEILAEITKPKLASATYEVKRDEYRVCQGSIVFRYNFETEGWTTDTYPVDIRSLGLHVSGRGSTKIDDLLGIIDDLEGKIDDLGIVEEIASDVMFVLQDQPQTMIEDETKTKDVLSTGELTDSEIVVETGILVHPSGNVGKALELHKILLEYESQDVQEIFGEYSIDNGISWDLYSEQDLDETFAPTPLQMVKPLVSDRIMVRLRSPQLGRMVVNSLNPYIVLVERIMPRKVFPAVSIAVIPSLISGVVGDTIQLTVTLYDQRGKQVFGVPILYLSTDAAIATVSSSGQVRLVGTGSFAIIIRTIDGVLTTNVAGTSTAEPVVVATITISPDSISGTVGQIIQFAALARDSLGNVITSITPTWASSNSAVAASLGNGAYKLVAAGSATATVAAGIITDTATMAAAVVPVATITISPTTFAITVGDTQVLTATVRDSQNNVLTGRVVTWASSDTSVATVSSSGVVTAVTSGAVTITATSEGKQTSSAGTIAAVAPPPLVLTTITVSPASFALDVAQTRQLTAIGRDQQGNTMAVTFTWTSLNPAVATVNSSGLVTAVGPGSTTIKATSGVVEGTSATTVQAVTVAPVDTVSVSPATFEISVGQTVQLTATPRDASSNPLLDRTVTWGSSNLTRATVSSSGIVTAIATGAVTITATCETVPGTSVGNVISVPVSTSIIPFKFTRLKTGGTVAELPFPFPQGALFAANLSKVRVFIGATEQAVYIEGRQGLHPDGSLRAIRMMCTPTTSPASVGDQVAGEVRLGVARGTVDIAKPSIDRPYPHPTIDVGADGTTAGGKTAGTQALNTLGYNSIVGLPDDPSYLLSCNLLEPMNTRTSELALGGDFAGMLNNFETGSANKWTFWSQPAFVGVFGNSIGDVIYSTNYYDRAKNHFAHWLRSGNVEYWRRACSYAYNQRAGYFQSNGYGVPGYSAFYEGQMMHYWVGGEDEARNAVIQMITRFTNTSWDLHYASRWDQYMDARELSRFIMGMVCAHRLGHTSMNGFNGTSSSATLQDRLRLALSQALSFNTYDPPGSDGPAPMFQTSGIYKGIWLQPFVNPCQTGFTNFMSGLLMDEMQKYYFWFEADPRIPLAIKDTCDWLWTNTWRPYLLSIGDSRGGSELSFNYLADNTCPQEGGTAPTLDLNTLYIVGFAFAWKTSGITTYRDRADQIFAGSNPEDMNEIQTEHKQFNQVHLAAWRYSRLRNG